MKHATNLPLPRNEPVLDYAPGSPQRARLKAAIADVEAGVAEIPGLVGGQPVPGGTPLPVTSPHRHERVVARLTPSRSQTGSAASPAPERRDDGWTSAKLYQPTPAGAFQLRTRDTRRTPVAAGGTVNVASPLDIRTS